MSLGQFKERREVIISIKESKKRIYIALSLGFLSGAIFTFLVIFFPSSAKVSVKIENQRLLQGDLVLLQEGEDVLFIEREKEKTHTLAVTGEKKVEEKARGVVRIYNKSSTSQPLVRNTRLLSKEGKLFRTTKYVVVPPKGYIDVEVVADEPGEGYNIGPTTFSVPGLRGTPQYTFVYAESFSPMTGGRITVTKVVSEQDIKEGADKALETIKQEELATLKEEFGKYFEVFPDTLFLEVKDYKAQASPGEEREDFQVTISYRLRAVLISPDFLREKALAILQLSLPPNTLLDRETLEITSKLEELDWESKKVTLLIKGSALLLPEIDKRDLISLPLTSAIELLSQKPLVKGVEIKIYPFWAQKLPTDPNKIEIKIERE